MATELENFYRENRIREADTVDNIYNDPKYASTIFNSSVPLNQLEKNIRQSKGATLEPYNPSLTDYFKSGASYVGENLLGMNNYQANKFGRQMFGDRGSDQFSKQIGFADIVPAFRGMHMAALPMIPAYANEAYRAFDRGDNIGGVIEGGAALLEGYVLGKPISRSLKGLAKSISSKLNGSSNTNIVPTKEDMKELGALPSNKVLANTKRMPPSMAMVNPRKLDDLGFYYKSEELANTMKQNKGSGTDFLNFYKGKGISDEELNQSGLIDLFQKDSVTKSEILNTIKSNKLKLIESNKSGDFNDGNLIWSEQELQKPPIYFNSYDEGVTEANKTPILATVYIDTKTGYRVAETNDGNFTFKPDADINNWRESEEAKAYIESGDSDFVNNADLNEIADQGNRNEMFLVAQSHAIRNGDYIPGDARFEEYTQPGGKNYKEFLLKTPEKENERLNYKNQVHYDDKNPVVHVRTKDRVTDDGTNTLYVEEFQSDWGQAGRNQGFASGAKYEENLKLYEEAKEEMYDLKDFKLNIGISEATDNFIASKKLAGETLAPNFRQSDEYRDYVQNSGTRTLEDLIKIEFPEKLDKDTMIRLIQARLQTLNASKFNIKGSNRFADTGELNDYIDQLEKKYRSSREKSNSTVPEGEFVGKTESWTKLGIKRLLQRAVKGNYESITISPGDVQADRWGNDGLIQHYDKNIKSQAEKIAGKNNVGTTDMTMASENTYMVVSMPADRGGKFGVAKYGTDKPFEFYDTALEAQNAVDKMNSDKVQKTLEIKITPELKDKVTKGLSLFGVGGASAIGLQEQIGALGNMPNDQLT